MGQLNLLGTAVGDLEAELTDQVASHLGLTDTIELRGLDDIQEDLRNVEQATGIKPGVIYVTLQPNRVPVQDLALKADHLDDTSPIATYQVPAHRVPLGHPSSKALHSLTPEPRPQPEILWQFSEDQFLSSNALPLPSAQNPASPPPKRSDDQLELVLVTSEGDPIRYQVAGATRTQVERLVRLLSREVSSPANTRNQRYLRLAQQLHTWIIEPLAGDLQTLGVENLLFAMDSGLRALPLAVLHDGEQFLIENYSVGMMPSLSLTDTRYRDVRGSQMLAMGASEFADQSPLPTVPLELEVLVGEAGLWPGQGFLNEAFNFNQLQRQSQGYGIVHLATHADFVPGKIDNSYIQLFNERLSLAQLRQLDWQRSNGGTPVELLTLSACRTAIGSEEAELGFAGLAVQAGVKSALASLWYVSDAGTAALMTQFYTKLQEAPLKAEALRQAQLSLARREVTVEGQVLQGVGNGGALELPSESVAFLRDRDLSHPYYWAAFTLVGSPW